MELGETKSCPDVDVKDQERRQSKLTAKAMAKKIERLQTERQAKFHKIKGVTKLIKELMHAKYNALSIQSHLKNVSVLFEDVSHLHESVIQ